MGKCRICCSTEALVPYKETYICKICIAFIKEQTKKVKKIRMSGY